MPSDFPAEDAATQTLRDGLNALPTPPVSPDFDARVLAALGAPGPWWRRWWEPARPLLVSAAGSLTLTLLLLHWSLTGPITPPSPAAAPPLSASAPMQTPSLDALLDSPNLCAASLMPGWELPPPDRRPPPPRHAQAPAPIGPRRLRK